MLDRRESNFDRAAKFLLNLALLVLLFVGLWRVVAPEVSDVLRSLQGGGAPKAGELHQRDPERKAAPADVTGGR